MPHLATDDGVKLYYEGVGTGAPIVFVHEFASGCRSWEHQLPLFRAPHRCIAYNAADFPLPTFLRASTDIRRNAPASLRSR